MSTLNIPCPKCGKELKLRDRSLLGKKGRCPSCQFAFVLEEPEEVQLELADAPAVGKGARWVPDGAAGATSVAPKGAAAPAFTVVSNDSGAERLKAMARKKRQRRNAGVAVGSVIGLVIAIAAVALQANKPGPTKPGHHGKSETAAGEERHDTKATIETLQAASPTQGKPIELKLVPLGARILINLHPAELWQKGSQGEEFRYCLGPLAEWLEAKIKEYCLFEPGEIEELLICITPGPQGEPPEVSGCVHLKEEKKRSEYITKFQGQPNSDFGYPAYVGASRAYVISSEDPKIFGFAPSSQARELVDAVKTPSTTDPSIEELLIHTDRDRHLTVVLRPDDLRVHHKDLVAENVQPLMNQLIDWFNPDEIETVAWSVHLEERKFHSDVLVRNKLTRVPAMLQRDLRKRMDALPGDLYQAVQMMHPKEVGKQQIIGRFPAMMAVFSGETTNAVASHYVQMSTILPERAAPNLALGALLAWDESTRTDFSGGSPKTPGSKSPTSSGGADTQIAKLGKQIEVDFRKTPLQDAFKYIADETGATIDIDGDGLKLSGYTKNMEQNMKLGNVPGMQAVREILKKYKDMCILVDEDKKKVTVTTKAVAEKLGKTPFDVGK